MSEIEKIAIRSESLPERCEICHQTDCFDPEKNYCSRCAAVLEAAQAPPPLPITTTDPEPFTPTNWVTGGSEMTSLFNPLEDRVLAERPNQPPSLTTLNLSRELNQRNRPSIERTRVDAIEHRPTFRIPPVGGIEPIEGGALERRNNEIAPINRGEMIQRPHRELATLFNQQSSQGEQPYKTRLQTARDVLIFAVIGFVVIMLIWAAIYLNI